MKFKVACPLIKYCRFYSDFCNVFEQFAYKMASQKDYLSINQVMATLHAENESELDSDSSSGIEEETDASADEFQASSTFSVSQ
jgi:hypothetical protein